MPIEMCEAAVTDCCCFTTAPIAGVEGAQKLVYNCPLPEKICALPFPPGAASGAAREHRSGAPGKDMVDKVSGRGARDEPWLVCREPADGDPLVHERAPGSALVIA